MATKLSDFIDRPISDIIFFKITINDISMQWEHLFICFL